MKQIELPSELMAYMTERGKFVFVNDFSGWGPEADIKHFKRICEMEGNGLQAENGEEFAFQCVSFRRGNGLTVQLRDHEKDTCEQLPLADLPLFKDFDVVIWTSGESLQGFAPVFSDKLDLAIFIGKLQGLGDNGDYGLQRKVRDMVNLAIFLYKNNPEKIPSILDEI